MCDVHELYEDFSYAWRSIAAADVGSRDHYSLNWSVFFALFLSVPFEILNEILIEEVLGIAHVEKLKDSAWDLASGFAH